MGMKDMLHVALCTLTGEFLRRATTNRGDRKDFLVKLIELQKIKRRVAKRDGVGGILAARDDVLSANRHECRVPPHAML